MNIKEQLVESLEEKLNAINNEIDTLYGNPFTQTINNYFAPNSIFKAELEINIYRGCIAHYSRFRKSSCNPHGDIISLINQIQILK